MKPNIAILDTSKKSIIKCIVWIGLFTVVELGMIFFLNWWRGQFWEVVEQRQMSLFLPLVGSFALSAFIAIYSNAASNYLENKLGAIWRIRMTNNYLPHYNKALNTKGIDNPDQRTSDDIRDYTAKAVPWIVGCIFNTIKFCLFLGLLIYLSNQIFGHGWILPLGTVIYTALGLGITILMGRSLVITSFESQKREADYRFGLAKWRAGNNDDKHVSRFWEAVKISLIVFKQQKYLGIWTQGFGQLSVIVPILFLAPAYFINPAFNFGLLMRAINGVSEAQSSLAYLVDQWQEITMWLACRNRLNIFRTHMKEHL